MDFSAVEKERKKRLKILIIFVVLGVLLVVTGIILLNVKIEGKDFSFVAQFFAIGGLVLFILGFVIPRKGYNKVVKREIENKVMQQVYSCCEKLNYVEHGGLSFEYFKKLKVFKRPDDFSTEDTISASYKDVEFISTEYIFTLIKHTVDSKGHVHEERINYPGRVFAFHLERDMSAEFSIMNKKADSNVFIKTPFDEKVEFESVDFNKKFITTTSSKENLFVLVQPKEIMKMIDVNNQISGDMSYIFIGNYVYFILTGISIEFNFPLLKKINDKSLQDIKRYYSVPLKLIDEFGLFKDKFNDTELDKKE